MKIILENLKCPSWNSLYAGQHWSVRKKLADEIHELVKWECLRFFNDNKKYETFEKCRIIFDIYYKDNRRHDPDNANIKLFIDGLVKAGIIKDDNSKIIKEISVRVHAGQRDDKIIIEINEFYASKSATRK